MFTVRVVEKLFSPTKSTSDPTKEGSTMFSSKAFRTAGLVALCFVIGGVFSGALGGAQQPPPQLQIIRPIGIPDIELGAIRSLDDGTLLAEVKECGITIAKIISFGIINHRKDDDLEVIGGIRAQEDISLGAFPKGDYNLFLGHVQGLNLPLPPELGIGWFMVIVDSQGKALALIYPLPRYPPWDPPVMDGDTMLLLLTPRNAIPDPGLSAGLECCDLTVRHLSVMATKTTPPCPPCPVPPCPPCPPPSWLITALATIANIGQIAVKEPFTVRVLLNGRLIHEEEIAELAAGAQQIILASETVYSPGLYTVTVLVDPDNKIKERNEMNNIAERSVNIQ
jgi:hypothetical protein